MSSNPIDPAVVAAEKRCTEAHVSHEAYKRTIDEIIANQDWKTLGYQTFIEDYWIDRFGGITATLGPATGRRLRDARRRQQHQGCRRRGERHRA